MNEITPITTQNLSIMSSLDIVEYENTCRKRLADADGAPFPSKGYARLEHADFLKKVPEVLGELAGNFSGYYTAANGKQNPCYNFPKREAWLMAMSYSYELQAMVFDRAVELEMASKKLALEASEIRRIERDYAENLKHSIEFEVGSLITTPVKPRTSDPTLRPLQPCGNPCLNIRGIPLAPQRVNHAHLKGQFASHGPYASPFSRSTLKASIKGSPKQSHRTSPGRQSFHSCGAKGIPRLNIPSQSEVAASPKPSRRTLSSDTL